MGDQSRIHESGIKKMPPYSTCNQTFFPKQIADLQKAKGPPRSAASWGEGGARERADVLHKCKTEQSQACSDVERVKGIAPLPESGSPKSRETFWGGKRYHAVSPAFISSVRYGLILCFRSHSPHAIQLC